MNQRKVFLSLVLLVVVVVQYTISAMANRRRRRVVYSTVGLWYGENFKHNFFKWQWNNINYQKYLHLFLWLQAMFHYKLFPSDFTHYILFNRLHLEVYLAILLTEIIWCTFTILNYLLTEKNWCIHFICTDSSYYMIMRVIRRRNYS